MNWNKSRFPIKKTVELLSANNIAFTGKYLAAESKNKYGSLVY